MAAGCRSEHVLSRAVG